MRYMMLVYSTLAPDGLTPGEAESIRSGHRRVMDDASRRGVLIGAEPLAPVTSATTVRMRDGQAVVTDGPFTETKEHLAGYYIMECANLDEAIEWAARIPTACRGNEGCIEIRPMPGLPPRTQPSLDAEGPSARNG